MPAEGNEPNTSTGFIALANLVPAIVPSAIFAAITALSARKVEVTWPAVAVALLE